MRASFLIYTALIVYLVAVLLPTTFAQPPPPHHESIIVLFNDSACTQHFHTERIPEPSSTKCIPDEFRHHNGSNIFTCTTNNVTNITTLDARFYNDTDACDNTPVFSFTSTAAEHSCAAISVVFEGQKANLYGHIECAEPPPSSRLAYLSGSAQRAVGAFGKREAQSTVNDVYAKTFASLFRK